MALTAPLTFRPPIPQGIPAPTAVGREGRAPVHAAGPPPGHTGGFGEPTCRECHSEYDLNVGGALSLEGLPASYEPGATYVVRVVLTSSEMEKAGFQAAARFLDGRQAGTLEPADGRTAVVGAAEGDVRYVQQVAAGTGVESPERAVWAFRWTAPGASGPVIFHASANSANGDDSPLGDLVYAAEVRIQEAVTTPSGPAAR